MSSQSQHYAERVLAAFEAVGLYTDEDIKDAGGPSSSTMTKLRKAAEGGANLAEPRGDTHRRVEAAAQWSRGSSRNLWRYGMEPAPSSVDPDTAEAIRRSNLPESAKQKLLALLDDDPPPVTPATDAQEAG